MVKPALSIGCGKPKVNLIYHNKHPLQCAGCHASWPFDEDAFYHKLAEELKEEIDRTIIEEVTAENRLDPV